MKFKNACYLPSGRVFLLETEDGYLIESTEMRDVAVDGKLHEEVRTSLDPHVIWKHLVPYETKWLLTVSTQKGCTHNCKFCDVAPLSFKGNLTREEIISQVAHLLHYTPYVKKCEKAKIGFARMGEPSHNLRNVLDAIELLPEISRKENRDINWLPCFNSILPKRTMEGIDGEAVIKSVIETKEKHYNGRLHFQISCNSTDEQKRKDLFGNAEVMTIEEIINIIKKEKITNRTVTLNFIIMDGVEIDVNKLMKMGLNHDKFAVKLIPLNQTENSKDHKLKTYANYNNYEKLLALKDKFASYNIPVVVDAIARCEEAGLCCGQLAQIYMDK